MGNKLSNSSVDRYAECSLCYKLHTIDRIRPVRQKSALLFGSALDTALNHLLLTKNLKESLDIFFNKWSEVDIDNTDFSKSDLDEELNKFYGSVNNAWTSLLSKGWLFIEQYHKDILPKIKKVIAVQEPVSLKNTDGDEIVGILDLIVEWEDGKTYLLDNKSSSVKYAPDSAKTGQQLPLYYYIVKDRYKLDGVGYIVLSKKINKNRVKKCRECGTINEGSHKKCPESYDTPTMNGEDIKIISRRCNGEFDITINPSVDWEPIFNQIDEADEARVLQTFDDVNYKIANGIFALEHNPNKNKFFQFCPYKDYYEGNPNFIKLETREK
jgi:hypothetical protein